MPERSFTECFGASHGRNQRGGIIPPLLGSGGNLLERFGDYMGAMDDKYRDLPERVSKVEARVTSLEKKVA